MLTKLFEIIQDRAQNPRSGSYTNALLKAGYEKIAQKVGEEAVEVIIAAKGQGNQRIIEEVSDLFYHTLVLLSAKGLSLSDVEDELRKRHQ